MMGFKEKLSLCLNKLARWNKIHLRGSLRRAIARKEREIQDLTRTKGPNWRREMIEAERNLENLLKEDEIYWKQTTREEWIKWGDGNTKWFHTRACHRRKINRITGLYVNNGEWTDKAEDFARIASLYF